MLLRQHTAVQTVIGGDRGRGWYPHDAVPPLPESPREAWVDVRVLGEGNEFRLEWYPYSMADYTLVSARGARPHNSLGEALADAHQIFGLDDRDWLARTPPPLSQADVITLRTAAVDACEEGVEDWGWELVDPELTLVQLPDEAIEQLWLVLRTIVDSTSSTLDQTGLFYDPRYGGHPIAALQPDSVSPCVGDYGSLWSAITSW